MLIIANPLQKPVHDRPLDVALREFVELGVTGLEVCTPALELCFNAELRRQFSKKIAETGLRFIRYNSLVPPYFDTLTSKDQVPGIIAAMKADGSVVTWGHARFGGDCTAVREEHRRARGSQEAGQRERSSTSSTCE